ncbi:DotH/IcmK family type IV secretion protein [Vibrio splendidus]
MKHSKSTLNLCMSLILCLGIAPMAYAETKIETTSVGTTNEYQIVDKNGQIFSVNLSEHELAIIKAKQETLKKYAYEEQQLDSLRTMLKEQDREKQVDEAINQKYPFTVEEIREMVTRDLMQKKAYNGPKNGSSNLNLVMKTITYDIAEEAPIDVKMVNANPASISFYDETGAPWPIKGEVLGDTKAFKFEVTGEKGHTAVIHTTPDTEFSQSIALINLEGMTQSFVIRLISDTSTTDARLTVKVPRLGPNAEYSVLSNSVLDNKDPYILEILNGSSFGSGERYEIEGIDGDAFLNNGRLYIKTKAKLLSPPPEAVMTSANGYDVYKLEPVTSLLFSDKGKMVSASIVESFEVDIKTVNSIFQ